jgi:hypothetical protein
MLLIFNPIYDQAFKYLMENNELAISILNLILDKEIVQLQMQNVETTFLTKNRSSTSRYDFKAIIKNENGEMQKVLIELQKYKNTNINRRFRFYLGQNYSSPDTFVNSEAETKTEELPIITVYILGYDCPEIPTRFLKIENKYIDGIKKQEISSINSNFLNLLTHNMYVLLIGEKENYVWQGTRIEAFMRLFIQKVKGAEKNILIEIDDSEINDPLLVNITKRLYEATLDEQMQRQMKAEQEYDETFRDNEKKDKTIEELTYQKEELTYQKEELTYQKEEERRQKEEERRQKEEERRQKEEERRQKEEERRQKEEAMLKLATKMKKYGEPLEEIQKETGISKEEIEKL